MKILDARVNWMSEFDNDPGLQVLVDRVPPLEELIYIERPLGRSACFLYAEKGGYVHYLYADTRDTRGFSGRGYTLKVRKEWGAEPVEETYIGPWSSRSAVANSLGFGPCVDASITDSLEAFQRGYTFSAGAITLGLAETACNFARHYDKTLIILEMQGAHNPTHYEIGASPALSGGQSTIVGGSLGAEVYFVPRKKMPEALQLCRQDRAMLTSYKAIKAYEAHVISTFALPDAKSDAAREASAAITVIERHMYKYYGPTWKQVLL